MTMARLAGLALAIIGAGLIAALVADALERMQVLP